MNNATQLRNKCIRTAILTEMAVRQHCFYICIGLDKKNACSRKCVDLSNRLEEHK